MLSVKLLEFHILIDGPSFQKKKRCKKLLCPDLRSTLVFFGDNTSVTIVPEQWVIIIIVIVISSHAHR